MSPQRGDTLSVPQAQRLLRLHRSAALCSDTATVAPRAYFFLSCQKKVCKKEAQDAKIALTRGKTIRSVVRIVVTPAVKERPSGDRRIGFPERTINRTNRFVCAR